MSNSNILTQDAIKEHLNNIRIDFGCLNPKHSLTNGCFDLFHAVHAQFLHDAQEYIQHDSLRGHSYEPFLWVALDKDERVANLKGRNRPVVKEMDRAIVLSQNINVDRIVIFDNLIKVIHDLKPSFYFKGGDYNLDTINQEERQALEEVGAEIIFIPQVRTDISTTKYIKYIKNHYMDV